MAKWITEFYELLLTLIALAIIGASIYFAVTKFGDAGWGVRIGTGLVGAFLGGIAASALLGIPFLLLRINQNVEALRARLVDGSPASRGPG